MAFAFDRFDHIDAQEYTELSARFAPLAAAVRGLVHASLRTDVDPDTLQNAASAVASITETLQRSQAPRSQRQLRHGETGRAVVWANPVTGLRNPLAPPLAVHHEPDGRCWSEFTLGEIYEGPPGLVHGGVCAMLLDQVLGEVATEGMTRPRFTGTITVKYLRGTPLGPLRIEAYTEREEEHKTYVRGFISDADGPTAEADGVFIKPAWARESSQ